MRDLETRADIEELVTAFYETAFADPLIGPVFTEIAKMDLAHHLPVMCDFWETVLFRAGLYHRNALQLHAALHARSPLTEDHFARWLTLWRRTLDERFEGPVARHAEIQATRIATSIQRRLGGGSGSLMETVGHRDAIETRPA